MKKASKFEVVYELNPLAGYRSLSAREGKMKIQIGEMLIEDPQIFPYESSLFFISNLRANLSADPASRMGYPAGIEFFNHCANSCKNEEDMDWMASHLMNVGFGGIEMCMRPSPTDQQYTEISWNYRTDKKPNILRVDSVLVAAETYRKGVLRSIDDAIRLFRYQDKIAKTKFNLTREQKRAISNELDHLVTERKRLIDLSE